ncbi:hypothetical protein Tco_0950804, partial [Tanacetum coccineum]
IESKSKVRNSRNKPVVAKVSSSTSTPDISSDVVELKDMVKALLLDKKNQSPAPTPVKAVEESCVTCGGTHSYQNCPATAGNVYRDNIQEYVSQAAAANYNQGNTGYQAPIANQIRPPGFSPVESKELPPHLEDAFMWGETSCPSKIAKDLSVEEKAALIKVLKSRKRAIAWKLSDIKGINPEFYTHKILMEEDYKPDCPTQRQDHMEQRMFAQLGYRKKKWGMSSNEEFRSLFILEMILEAKGRNPKVNKSKLVSKYAFLWPGDLPLSTDSCNVLSFHRHYKLRILFEDCF